MTDYFGWFMTLWAVTIVVSCFIQGAWGEWFESEEIVSPIAVGFLWPFVVGAATICSPVWLPMVLGMWFKKEVLDKWLKKGEQR